MIQGENMNKKSRFFVKTPFMMDKKEKHLYDVLLHAVDFRYYIWPKVHLADLLQPTNELEEKIYEEFCQLANKHVDFILCEKEKFHPILVIRFKRMISHPDEINKKEESTLIDILDIAGIPLLIESAAELDSYRKAAEYEAVKIRITKALKKAKPRK